uniref:C2 domain-containing protein n=1 Tax=Scleropages formosus TaxID=113540 RepID=A0A8C9T9X5_SCLFO
MQDETQRLSRCLSAGSLPSNSGSVEADGLAEDGLAEDSGEEDRIRGSLRFSLFYDQLRSRLVVTVLGAQRLPTRDFSCSVDPFVHVRLLRAVPGEEDGEGAADEAACCVLHEWRSRLVKGCSSPAFGDEFSCTLAKDEVPSVTVRMEVRDFDRYSRHGVLGEIRAPLDGLDISYPLEVTEDLAAPRKQDQVGKVLLSLRYLPISQRLEVGLLKVRAFCRQVANDKALYARICVVCNRRKLQHQSTSLRTRWDVTVFNETVTFTLPDQPVRECAVTVSVYEVAAGRKSSRRLVGQAALGKAWGSEDEHWRLMMRSLRQTVARWHPLYI